MNSSAESVTVVVAQKVKPGREVDYEKWISAISRVSNSYLGHMGTQVIRPQSGVRSEYVVVFRFDNYEHLKAWMTSRERQDWIDRARPLVASDAQVQQVNGLEAWFSLPGQVAKAPPRYKMALLTWAAVYTLIVILNRAVAPLLQAFPKWVVTLIICGITVGLLTYIVMPQITRLFKRWLYPGSRIDEK